MDMKIVWDEPKRLANLEKHALDFADLEQRRSSIMRWSFPRTMEQRWVAVGVSIRGVIVVVFARLGREGVSVIEHAAGKPVLKGSSMPKRSKKISLRQKDLREVQ